MEEIPGESLLNRGLRLLSENPMITNLAVVFGLNQLLDDVSNFIYVVAAFTLVQACLIGTMGYIYLQIEKNNDQTVLVYTDLAVPGDSSSAETVRKTVAEHDNANLMTHITTQLFQIGLMAFLNYQFGYLRPLILQCVLSPRQFMGTQIYRVYISNNPIVGDLVRPWKTVNPLSPGQLPSTKELKAKEKKEQKKKLK
ncbi:hypothetical protein HK096_005215 [Nowakowskiella sp. JEL0078]|nr:hypothetical protein HK096_005215 [Nowakowskiella sp. JEL0078]